MLYIYTYIYIYIYIYIDIYMCVCVCVYESYFSPLSHFPAPSPAQPDYDSLVVGPTSGRVRYRRRKLAPAGK